MNHGNEVFDGHKELIIFSTVLTMVVLSVTLRSLVLQIKHTKLSLLEQENKDENRN